MINIQRQALNVLLQRATLYPVVTVLGPLMASPNSPTHGHPKFPQAAPSDYDPSAWMAKRAAASLSL